jgi:hypothetical protein
MEALYRYLDGYRFALVSISGLNYENDSPGPVTVYGLDICQGRMTYYYLRGSHSFVAPAGFEPPSVSFNMATPVVGINC